MKKRGKKGILWLLAVVMIMTAMPVTAFGSYQYDLGRNKYIDVKKTPSGKTGQNMTINMVFTNDTGNDLTDVSVAFDDSAVGEEYDAIWEEDEGSSYTGEIFPFEVTSSTFNPKVLGTVKAGSSKSFALSARVRRDISEGYYTVPLVITANGSEGGTTDRVNIWISKSTGTTEPDENDGSIRFILGENQNTPSGAYPEVMNFDINLRNASNITAFDVRVKIGLSEDSAKFPFEINDGNYGRSFERIGGGETVAVPYSMAIREEVYSGYYPITFTIEYRDSSDGEIQKTEEIMYVRIKNKEREEQNGEFNINDRTKARLIVDGYETNPETVYAGDEFELTLRMKNASADVAASNILFTLESEKVSDSAVFTTDAGSSSVVVNSLGAGQTTELKIKMQAGAWVDQRNYAITINEKYDSPEFKNAEEKVAIDIPVKQMARLNTGTVEVMPESISVGSESNVMFSINNTGKVLLYNVMVTFAGDTINQTDTYVGNIKPGETGNVDAMITGTAPTTDDGKVKILITYEDENGVVSDPIEKEMTLMVTEAMQEDFGMMQGGMIDAMPVEAEPTGIQKYKKFLIPGVIAVIAAGAAAAVVIAKKRKKKKEAEEIDDEI